MVHLVCWWSRFWNLAFLNPQMIRECNLHSANAFEMTMNSSWNHTIRKNYVDAVEQHVTNAPLNVGPRTYRAEQSFIFLQDERGHDWTNYGSRSPQSPISLSFSRFQSPFPFATTSKRKWCLYRYFHHLSIWRIVTGLLSPYRNKSQMGSVNDSRAKTASYLICKPNDSLIQSQMKLLGLLVEGLSLKLPSVLHQVSSANLTSGVSAQTPTKNHNKEEATYQSEDASNVFTFMTTVIIISIYFVYFT